MMDNLKYSKDKILALINSGATPGIDIENMLVHIVKNKEDYRQLLNTPYRIYDSVEDVFSGANYRDSFGEYSESDLQVTLMIELMGVFGENVFVDIDKHFSDILSIADFSQPKQCLANVVCSLMGKMSYSLSNELIKHIKDNNIPYSVWGGRPVYSDVGMFSDINRVDLNIIKSLGFGAAELLSMSEQKYPPELLFKTLCRLSEIHSRDAVAIFTDDLRHLVQTQKIEELPNDLIKILCLSNRKDLLYVKLTLDERLEKFNHLYARLESFKIDKDFVDLKNKNVSGLKL